MNFLQNHVDSNLKSNKLTLEPSPKLVAIKKIAASILCAFIYVSFISSFPINKIKGNPHLLMSIQNEYFLVSSLTLTAISTSDLG